MKNIIQHFIRNASKKHLVVVGAVILAVIILLVLILRPKTSSQITPALPEPEIKIEDLEAEIQQLESALQTLDSLDSIEATSTLQ